MENNEVSGRDNYINCHELWMNIVSEQATTLDPEQLVMKKTFSAAVSALKKKCLLLASIFGLGLTVMGAHMLAFIVFVSDDLDVDINMKLAPLGIDLYDTVLILFLAGGIPVLLTMIGAFITSISARRSGEAMTCAGLVIVQAAAILSVLMYGGLIALLFTLPVIITSALFILLWVTVFFSARNVKRSVKWGTPKRIPYPMALFCFASALVSVLFVATFTFAGEDFIIWERLGFGALSFAALIAPFCFEAFVHAYNNAISIPRNMVKKKTETAKNPLFTVADGEENK